MRSRISTLLTVLVLVGLVLFQSVFVIQQVEQGLVVQLGKPIRPVTDPGLHFKIPFLQQVYHFDNRLLVFDQDPQEVLSADKKNLKVDNFARWRIVDPLRFFQTVRTELGAAARLNDIIYSNLREVLGQFNMMDIVSGSNELMSKIQDQVNRQSGQYGIEVVDVRIKRTDLPPENSKAVYRRMQTERERQAKQYRAEGEEEAVKIRAKADRERAVLLADAYRQTQKIMGDGDATATAIYANAYQKDPKFYEFTRSLESYRRSFARDATLVLEPDSGFFRFFKGAPESTP